MNFYEAFGICIKSEINIPQFVPTKNRHAVASIRFGDVRSIFTGDVVPERAIKIKEREFCFFWDQIGSFLVRNGNEIVVDPLPEADEQMLRLPLIGILSAALLQQRGILVLHASAVSINGGAAVFVGWKGAGKSTTAAMLYGRGHSLISDDIVGITNSDKGPLSILPAFPSLKLMPETAVATLADNPECLTRIYSGAEKRFRSSADNFSMNKVPLKAIYTLEEGPEMRTTLLKPQEAISSLIANTYLSRYGKRLLQNADAITNFRQCSNIVNTVPIFRLERPKSFALLQDYAQFVESHLSNGSPAA